MRPNAPEQLAAIAVGGAIGSLGRWAVSLAMPHPVGQWPWATLLINLTGCLLMGLLVARLAYAPAPHPLFRPFLGVGMLGGWTTFSTFAVETLELANAGRGLLAVAYVVLSVTFGVVAVGLGNAAGQRVWSDREARS